MEIKLKKMTERQWDWFWNRLLLPFRVIYHFLSLWVVGLFFRMKYDLKVYGRQNIPSKGAFIVAANHCSHLDPPLLGVVVKRPLRYFAKRELFEGNVLFNYLIRSQGAIPIDTSGKDIKRFIHWIDYFAQTGQPFVIFPEGQRTTTGDFLPAKPGIGFAVVRTKLAVLPIYIRGTFEALPPGEKRLFPSKIRVIIGKLIDFSNVSSSRDSYQKIADEVMDSIKHLSKKLDGMS